MNPLHPDIQQLGDGVWIPMPLAIRLFACYFGDGPRLLPNPRVEGSTPSAPPPTPIAPVPAMPSASHSEVIAPIMVDPRSSPRGWKPRGVAARTYPSGDNTSPPPSTKDATDDARPA